MKKFLWIFLCLATGFCIYILITLHWGGYIEISSLEPLYGYTLVAFLSTFITTAILTDTINAVRPGYTAIALWAGLTGTQSYGYIYNYAKSGTTLELGTDLLIILLWTLSILCAYLFTRTKKVYSKVACVVIPLTLTLLLIYRGNDMAMHRVNFDSYTGLVHQTVDGPLFVFSPDGEKFDILGAGEDYILLDFWFTGCRPCYEEMPLIKELYSLYGGDERIKISTVHAFGTREDHSTGPAILKEWGFELPSLAIKISDSVLKDLGINVYSTVLIFDNERTLVLPRRRKTCRKIFEEGNREMILR